MDDLHPKDHAEAVALFRCEVIGALTRRDLARGELHAELTALSQKRYRPPQAKCTRSFWVTSLERWFYAYRSRGLAGLRPEARSDRGRGRDLAPTLRTLLLDIRREQPSASVPLILRTLVAADIDSRRMVIQVRDAKNHHDASSRYRPWRWRRASLGLREAGVEPGRWHREMCVSGQGVGEAVQEERGDMAEPRRFARPEPLRDELVVLGRESLGERTAAAGFLPRRNRPTVRCGRTGVPCQARSASRRK